MFNWRSINGAGPRDSVYVFSALGLIVAVIAALTIADASVDFDARNMDRIIYTLKTWSTKPLGEHYYLFFLPDDVAPYENRPFFSGLLYAGVYIFARDVLPFSADWATYFYFLSLSIVVIHLTVRHACKGHSLAFSLGCVVIALVTFFLFAHLHWYLLAKNHDNSYAFAAVLVFWISMVATAAQPDRVERVSAFASFLVLPLFGHLTPLFFCLFLFAFWSKLFGRLTIAVIFSLTLLNVVLPKVIIAMVGMPSVGSDLVFRMGLDGDTQFFSSHLEAIFNPRVGNERWLIVATALALFAATCFIRRTRRVAGRASTLFSDDEKRMFTTFIIASSGWVGWAILMPQAIAIHPYIFDFLWMVPLQFSVVYLVIRSVAFWSPDNLGLREYGAATLFLYVMAMNAVKFAQYVS